MKSNMRKKELLKELSLKTNLPESKISEVIQALTAIVYREASNGGFTLPDICKFSVVTRKATKRWHPVLQKYVLFKEHKTLKITPVKKAKEHIVPKPAEAFEIISQQEVEEASHETKNLESTVYTEKEVHKKPELSELAEKIKRNFENKKQKDNTLDHTLNIRTEPLEVEHDDVHSKNAEDTRHIVFACPNCKNTVIADVQNAGMVGECPYCSANINVPTASSVKEAEEPSSEQSEQSDIKQPAPDIDRSSMTIRMNINDLKF